MDPMTRAMGILVIGEGVTIRAYPQTEDRTAIELAPDNHVGNIVRDPESGPCDGLALPVWRLRGRARALAPGAAFVPGGRR